MILCEKEERGSRERRGKERKREGMLFYLCRKLELEMLLFQKLLETLSFF
jgi:hypothetical protein